MARTWFLFPVYNQPVKQIVHRLKSASSTRPPLCELPPLSPPCCPGCHGQNSSLNTNASFVAVELPIAVAHRDEVQHSARVSSWRPPGYGQLSPPCHWVLRLATKQKSRVRWWRDISPKTRSRLQGEGDGTARSVLWKMHLTECPGASLKNA
jgi:hypothetical protein